MTGSRAELFLIRTLQTFHHSAAFCDPPPTSRYLTKNVSRRSENSNDKSSEQKKKQCRFKLQTHTHKTYLIAPLFSKKTSWKFVSEDIGAGNL